MTTVEDCYMYRAWKRIALYERSRRREAEAERDALARRIEAVRALHHPWGDTLTGKYICDACDHPLPCPTIRALDGEDGTAPREN